MNLALLILIIAAASWSVWCVGKPLWDYSRPRTLASRGRKAARKVLQRTYYIREGDPHLENALFNEGFRVGIQWVSPMVDIRVTVHLLEQCAEVYTNDQLYALLNNVTDDIEKRDNKLRKLYFSGQLSRKWAQVLVDCDYNADQVKMLIWKAMRETMIGEEMLRKHL